MPHPLQLDVTVVSVLMIFSASVAFFAGHAYAARRIRKKIIPSIQLVRREEQLHAVDVVQRLSNMDVKLSGDIHSGWLMACTNAINTLRQDAAKRNQVNMSQETFKW